MLDVSRAVINNSGGKIFERMFPQPEFRNEHGIDFEGWARMWKLGYERWTRIPALAPPGAGARVIELVPGCRELPARFWKVTTTQMQAAGQ